MKTRIVVIILSILLLCVNLSSCSKPKVVKSDEYNLEESIVKFEKSMEEKYDLPEFDLIRIMLINPKGVGAKTSVLINGFYQSDGNLELFYEFWELGDDDKKLLGSIWEDYYFLIYAKEEARNLENWGEIRNSWPIRTDPPAWAIEGVYNIVFDD